MATNIGEAYIEIRTNQAKFSKELKSMEGTVKSSTDRMKKNFDRIGKGVSELSRTARLGFLAMSAAIAGTVYAAAKYEKQMANVATMLSRKSMPIMKKYKDLVGKMGIIFGESTETLSKGLYDILSASIRPEKALKVLAVSAKAAAAGVTDTGVAADAITTIMNSYGYAAEDAGIISDKLFTIIKAGKTTFAELGPNIGKVAATAAMAGLSFDELGATIATVTKAGIRTEMAMTAINGILKVFVKPTDDAKKAAKEFGLELNTNTLETIGLVGVLELLNDATAEQLALIFPEIEGLKGVAAAVGDLTGYTEIYKAMLESAGATQEAYLKQTNTLTFTFNQLKEAGKYLAVQVGEIFTPIVSQAIKKITDLAIKLGQAIKGLTSDQKDSVAQMVLFGTAVLGAIGSLSLFAVAARLVMAAGSVIAGVLGLIFSPLGLLIVGIGALVLAWTLGWKKIKEITSKLVEIVVMPTIKFVGEKIENLADWIQEKLGIPEEARKGIWELTDITANIDFFVKLLWGGIINIAGTIKDWVIGQSKLEDPIGELVAKVADFLIELPDPAKWLFKIGTRVWEYASLGVGIWWAAKGLLSAVKFAPIALPALLPILVGIGLALVGIDVLGNKLKEKLEEEDIEGLLDEFSKTHPLGMKLAVAIKEITGLEVPLILAYINEKWDTIAKKLSLILFQAQIILDIVFDIDIQAWWTEFWKDFKEGFKVTWVDPWIDFGIAVKEAWESFDWSWFGFDEVKDFFKDIWESFDWSWLNWDNFVTALKEAWDNMELGWWGDSIKWLFGLFKKDVEEETKKIGKIEIDWSGLWGKKADAQTREAIDNISGLRETVEKEIGEKIPKEFDALITTLIASESAFDSSATNMGGAAVGLGQITQGALDDINASLKTAGSKWEFTLEDMQDPVKNLQASLIYFGIVSKRNDHDLVKSITYWKGWGKEIIAAGGDLKKMPKEAQKQFNAFLKICKDFGIDAVDLMTLIGKKMVGGSGGIIGELEDGQVELKEQLGKMTGQMSKMVNNMSKIFMPIIDIFKVIFARVISVIKKFDEEAGTELENFVNETLGLIDDMFGGMEKGTEEMSLTVRRLFRDIAVDVKGEIKGITEAAKTFAEKAAEIWTDAFEAIGRSARDNIVDVINGAKTMSEAFIDFGQTLQTQIADAFWNLAVAAAKASDWAKAAWMGAVSIIISTVNAIMKPLMDAILGVEEAAERVQTAWGEFSESFELGGRIMVDYLKDLANRFSEIGVAISNTIEASQRKLQGLYQSIEDLGKGTREKLIAELDKYYDYQILRDMDLTELLALSAKTREEIEKGTLVSVAETAEETAAREKDAKVNALKEIEDAHKREMDLINQRILLTKIEIKLFELQMTDIVTGGRKRYEIQKELNDLLGEYDEIYGDVKESTDDATQAAKEYGREGRKAADKARIGIELWGEEISKIPKKIDFDVIGHLDMPTIPHINPRYFDIFGQYRAPDIPSYQGGIPYIPRTQVAVLHPKEAVLTAPQAEEWRAGKGGGGGETQVTYERGAIRMTVMGNLNNQVDLEEAMDYLAKKQTEKMRRP